MSRPTVLGPWFVVQQLYYPILESDNPYIVYYTAMEDGTTTFDKDKKRTLLFMSLGSAARVAQAETAEVRVLTTQEEAKEFGRD